MEAIILAAQALSPWELVAVICALAYLLLAVKENIWCWFFAFISTVIYTVLFWNVNLLMDSALNIYYLIMAVYGWYHWSRRSTGNNNPEARLKGIESTRIRSLGTRQQLWIIAIIAILTAVSGYFLSNYSSAVWPYIDSFTTWASVVTTYLVAQKYLQNWLYWIVIDSVCVPLYIERGLALTALLFFFYVIIVIFGYFRWKQQYMDQLFDERSQGPNIAG